MAAVPPTTPRSPVLFLASVVLAGEALASFLFGLVQIPQIRVSRLVVGAGVALLMLGYGASLLIVARGVALGRRWSRGPAVATQLLQGLLAFSFAAGQTWWVGLLLATAAVTVLGCLLSPPATLLFVEPGEGKQ